MKRKLWIGLALIVLLVSVATVGTIAVMAAPHAVPGSAPDSPAGGPEVLAGVITKLTGSGFTLKNPKSEVVVTLAPDVWVFVGGKKGELSDLKDGGRASVAGTRGADGILTAKFVMARRAPVSRPNPGARPGMMGGMLFGEVVSIDASTGNIKIKTQAGEEKSTKLTDKTVVVKADRSKGSVADITVGVKVMLQTIKNAAGDVEARRVAIVPAGFTPGTGPGTGPNGLPGAPRMPRMPWQRGGNSLSN